MTKDHAQGVFIRFIDFRGELLLRASAIDGVAPAGKNGADEANKALERFYFRLSASGAHAERAARDSLTRAIRSLYDVAFYADDLDALNELSELICAAECGEHIEPYKLGNIA